MQIFSFDQIRKVRQFTVDVRVAREPAEFVHLDPRGKRQFDFGYVSRFGNCHLLAGDRVLFAVFGGEYVLSCRQFRDERVGRQGRAARDSSASA
jgi:hypothetical protein